MFKVLMELIIIVFIKLMGTAISGHCACETQGLRETMTLLCGLLVAVRVRPGVAVRVYGPYMPRARAGLSNRSLKTGYISHDNIHEVNTRKCPIQTYSVVRLYHRSRNCLWGVPGAYGKPNDCFSGDKQCLSRTYPLFDKHCFSLEKHCFSAECFSH